MPPLKESVGGAYIFFHLCLGTTDVGPFLPPRLFRSLSPSLSWPLPTADRPLSYLSHLIYSLLKFQGHTHGIHSLTCKENKDFFILVPFEREIKFLNEIAFLRERELNEQVAQYVVIMIEYLSKGGPLFEKSRSTRRRPCHPPGDRHRPQKGGRERKREESLFKYVKRRLKNAGDFHPHISTFPFHIFSPSRQDIAHMFFSLLTTWQFDQFIRLSIYFVVPPPPPRITMGLFLARPNLIFLFDWLRSDDRRRRPRRAGPEVSLPRRGRTPSDLSDVDKRWKKAKIGRKTLFSRSGGLKIVLSKCNCRVLERIKFVFVLQNQQQKTLGMTDNIEYYKKDVYYGGFRLRRPCRASQNFVFTTDWTLYPK